jgi:hypothetical protein
MDDKKLTEAEIELIAERAADKAIQKIQAEVGKNVINKLFLLVGAAAIALIIMLNGGKWPQ